MAGNIRIFETKNPTVTTKSLKLSQEELKEHSSHMAEDIKIFNSKHGAPSPELVIKNTNVLAQAVVDRKAHKTFIYNEEGKFIKVFPDAVGAPTTPTPAGVRYITRIGSAPYKTSDDTPTPKKSPNAFGPHILYDRVIDTKSGDTKPTGIFFHGTNHPESMGKDASHGCVRHKNNDINEIVDNGYITPGNFINIM
ncbi:MAG: L,D-transpeptidase [bacterium]